MEHQSHVVSSAAGFPSLGRIDEERHCVKPVLHVFERLGSKTAILSLLDTRLVSPSLETNPDRGDGNPDSKVSDTGADGVFPIFFKKCVPKQPRVPIRRLELGKVVFE